MTNRIVTHENGDGRGLSTGLWRQCPWESMADRPGKGFRFHDDFENTPVLSTSAATGKYTSYADTGCTITQLGTEEGGVCRLSLDGTGANDEVWLTTGGNTGAMGAITSGGQRRWFEARIRSSIITDGAALFIGLGQEGLGATNSMVDATTVLKAAADWVGFRTLTGEAEGLDAVYQEASQTQVVVQNVAHTLVAATWVKVGMYFDGKDLIYFVDGTEVGRVAINSSTTDFPDGEELCPVIGAKSVAETARTIDIDWWAYAGLSQAA